MDAAVPWRVRDAALLLGLGLGVLLLSLLGAQGYYRLQGPPTAVPPQPPAALGTIVTVLFYLAILLGAWLLVVRRYHADWAALGLRLPRRTALLPGLLLFVGLAVGLVAVIAGMVWGLSALGIQAPARAMSDVPAPSDPLFAVSVLGAVLLTPVAEEVLFRGILYQSLRKSVGVIVSTATSALVFAVLHLRPTPAAAPAFLLLGIVLAVAFERTRSLYPSMLMHATYNAVIVVLALRVV